MRQFILIASSCALLAGCAIVVDSDNGQARVATVFGSTGVDGNSVYASEQRSVLDLPGLEVSGPLQVEVHVGAAPSLRIEGDSNLLPYVRTENLSTSAGSKLVRLFHDPAGPNTLRIWVDQTVATGNPLRVIYTVPHLRHIHTEGSGTMTVDGLNGETLHLDSGGNRTVELAGKVSYLELQAHGAGSVLASGLAAGGATVRVHGASHLELGSVLGDEFKASVQGLGSVTARGSVRRLVVTSKGKGSADLASLGSTDAELDADGLGDMSVAVSSSVVAHTTGSGRITVHGDPAQRNTSGRNISFVR